MHSHCSDVLIHIDQELRDEEIEELARDIGCVPGVYSACVNDRARHLMLIEYDPEGVRARQLLTMVRQHGVGAALVGL